MAPLEAALRGLCALLGVFISQGPHRYVEKTSRRIYQAVQVLMQAGRHNIRADRKHSMLASPECQRCWASLA